MRALVWAALAAGLAAGCASLLGIEDPRGDQCSPFDASTCAQNETCDIWEAPILTCRPEGGLGPGEICDGAADTCRGPLSCVNGVCRTICGDLRGCEPNDNESTCALHISSSTKICDNACDVLSGTGCLDNVAQQCVLVDFEGLSALCVPEGYFGNVAEGEPCSQFEQCGRGLACDLNGSGRCVPLCDFASPSCNNGGTCTEIGRLHETLDVGLCSL